MDLGLFVHFARLRMRERMEYRAAYVFGVVAQIMGWGANYAVIYLLLHRFRTINGWTWPQIAFLFSLDLLSYGLGAAFAFSPMVELEQMVADGSFDTILVRPLDPLLHLAARKYNVGYLAHIILSGTFLLWSVRILGVAWMPQDVIFVVLAIAGASCLQAAALIAVGSLAFIVVRTRFAFGLYFTLKGFLAYPVTLYAASIQWLLTVVVPLAFINFYPAALVLHKEGAVLPSAAGWATPVVGLGALLVAYSLFRRGVGRYQGAGG